MNQHPGIIGTKIGMTDVFTEDGNLIPCTVIQAGCRVVGKRTRERDGYDALVLGVGEKKAKRSSKAVRTAFQKLGQSVPQTTREVRTSSEHAASIELGQVLKLEDIFQEGQHVDVQGRSKGRGFTGVMVRHKFKGSTRTHGTHEWRRHGGSIGTNMTPGRVLPGRKMAGQHGNKIVTVLSQRIVKIVTEKQLLLVEGNAPGAPGAIVRVKGAVKKRGGKRPAP